MWKFHFWLTLKGTLEISRKKKIANPKRVFGITYTQSVYSKNLTKCVFWTLPKAKEE